MKAYLIWHDVVTRTKFNEIVEDEKTKLNLSDSRREDLEKLFDDSRKSDYHKTAIKRLTYLYQMYEWSDTEKKRFEEILLEPENMGHGRAYLGDFLPSTLSQFVDDKNIVLDPEEDISKIAANEDTIKASNGSWRQNEWNRIIEDIKSDCIPWIATSYSSELRNATGFVERHSITDNQIQELADVLLTFCNKLADCLLNDNDGYKKSTQHYLMAAGQLMGEAILSANLIDDGRFYSDDKVNEICGILRANNVPCSLLSFCLNEPHNRTDVIIQNLFNRDEEYANEAAVAISVLVRNHISICEEVKYLLTNSFFTNIGVKISPYVRAIELLLRKELLTDEQVKRIDQALPKYLELTSFKEYEVDDVVADKIILRKNITYLAHTLVLLSSTNGNIVEGARSWKKDTNSPEEFAEIRNCWDEISGISAQQ